MIKFFIEPGYEVKKPERDFGNAGVDFFIPNNSETFMKAFNEKNDPKNAIISESHICIKPHSRVNIPSGVRSRISPNVALEAQNKSGVAAKLGLVYGASTVDANYQGIIHINLINTTDEPISLPFGMKIIQFIPRLIDTSSIEVYDNIAFDDFYADFEFSNRGEGAFGSTNV